ncbi:SET domain containing lysine methyltransferase KMTox [Toxoplasma gondii ME49]|uniref:SET domain containing lysine methyltransferase KMTox n=3 Tax=Toxoplasma gondii TaxID=5811 RepID=A0A2G8XXZ7_TOXGO|nr:SET domain containing lysine methyltransferase KMTox [Toxoplasma gondii ME49]EPT30354.1 SET domain containing lysine methyltransferase KMTox [Toxoplasma gondii ME49]PIL99903.1 SET domain containing lysine methyltransferase KMTox [Toxoplasma gondii COUG]|eukprot:XP_002371399.1 SET domain containing lysine methyltransferase KMTox [Toxoplasma gondii ME49]
MASECVDENSKPWMRVTVSCALLPEVLKQGAEAGGAVKLTGNPSEQSSEDGSHHCSSNFQNSPVTSDLSVLDASPCGLPAEKRKPPHRETSISSNASQSEREIAPTATRRLSPKPETATLSPSESSSLTAATLSNCSSRVQSSSDEKIGNCPSTSACSVSQTTASSEAPSWLSSGASTAQVLSERRGSIEEQPAPETSAAAVRVSRSSSDSENLFASCSASLRNLEPDDISDPENEAAAPACAETGASRAQDAAAVRADAENLGEGESHMETASTRAESLAKDAISSKVSRRGSAHTSSDASGQCQDALPSVGEGKPGEMNGREEDGEAEKPEASAESLQGSDGQANESEAPKPGGGRVDAKMRAKFKREFVRSWVDINRAPSWPPIKKNKYLSSDWKRVDLRTAAGEIRVETKKHRLFLNDLCFLFDGVYTQKSTLGRKAGLGLFCERPEGLHKGQIITEFVGWLVDRDLAESYRKQRTASHIVAVQKGFLYIDGAKEPAYGMGGGSFANDGSEFLGGPGNNAQFYHWFDDELGRTRVFLRATADIKNGEEIFVPYHKTYWVDNFEEQAENCPDAFKQRKLEQLRRRYKNPEFVHIPHREEVAMREREEAERRKRDKEESEKKKAAAKQPRCPVKRPCSAYLLFSVARRKELLKACGILSKGDDEPASQQVSESPEVPREGQRKRRASSASQAAAPVPAAANKRRKAEKDEPSSPEETKRGQVVAAAGLKRGAARPACVGDETAQKLAGWLAKDGAANVRTLCAELTREVAREWGNMRPEEKKPWEQLAEKEKIRYAKAVRTWREKLKKKKSGRETATRKRKVPCSRKGHGTEKGEKAGKVKPQADTSPREAAPEGTETRDHEDVQAGAKDRAATQKER